jgi:hypothetical protein
MTKKQTVELLQQQLPGFYSVEQVINLINDIEEGGVTATEDQVEDLINKIEEAIERRLCRMDSDDLVDRDSAEFELYGNEISLSSVEANSGTISEECAAAARNVLTDFFRAPSE